LETPVLRIIRLLDEGATALTHRAQPLIVAVSTAGLTGGAMAAAGMLAGRMMRKA
jgi:hypothetical protein